MQDSAAIRLLILGSCVSRDILGHQAQQEERLKLVDYYARSSLASLAATSLESPLPACLENIKCAFQLRMVQRDMRKMFYDDLTTAEYDVLLIDVIDERFNLWMGADGCVCTLSNELVQTGFLSHQRGGKEVVSGSDEFWRMWEDGWAFFVRRLSALDVLDRVRVNKVFWSASTQSGCGFGGGYTPARIASANQMLERMYRRIAHDIPAHQFLVFDAPCLVAADSHQWGISPFHYVADYYTAALRQLCHKSSEPRTDVGTGSADGNSAETATAAYDISAWKMPLHQYASIESAVSVGISSDGIHQIAIAKGKTLDLCVQDLALLKTSEKERVILIGLSGAVASRNGKKAPFFSGLGIARSLGLPLIAISDPTLALDPNLPLAWYAGSEEVPDLPKQMARVLEGLAKRHQARLVIFGGSGAGYAGLLLATLLECRATVLVWNPQTAIADYVPRFVEQYLEAAFPSLLEALSKVRGEVSEKQGERLREVLEASTITHDVRGLKLRPRIDLLYLQNQGDWHVARHAVPYLSKTSWRRVGEAAFVEQQDNRFAIFFGQWGEGHVAPPKAILEAVLRKLAEGESLGSVVLALDGGLGGLCDASSRFHWVAEDRGFQLEARACVENARVYATSSIGEKTHGLTYAFYLLVDGKRCAMRWYEPNPEVYFDLPSETGKLEVVAFVRDGLGSQVNVRVPVMGVGNERSNVVHAH